MDVSEDDQKVFEGKLEVAGKLKVAGVALQVEELGRLPRKHKAAGRT